LTYHRKEKKPWAHRTAPAEKGGKQKMPKELYIKNRKKLRKRQSNRRGKGEWGGFA